jgi:phosphotriesterase-related protein
MKPYLDEAAERGVTGLVECSTIGVGRNVEVMKTLAENTDIHIIMPTGVYREAYIPDDIGEKSIDQLIEAWVKDIRQGIDGTDVKAGFIKMSVSDEGITDLEAKNLEAAVQTSKETGAIIASHTIGGQLAAQEIDLLARCGLDLSRFIWTHAQSEPDTAYHMEAAKQGIYISIDAIGSGWVPDDDMLAYTIHLIEAGYSDKILLSHDAGWYDPSQPDGHPAEMGIRGYTALFDSFLPALKARGISEATIDQITIQNPAEAFALEV